MIFDRAVAMTFDIEGRDKLSDDREDPGNWTGGKVGVGIFRGTRWGFSAASFPDLDIQNLTEDHATGMAFAEFWMPAKCGVMAPRLAVLMFDAAFQHGVEGATKMLQAALGLHVDGVLGVDTGKAIVRLAAADASSIREASISFQAQRAMHMAGQSSWARIGESLAGRLMRVMTEAVEISMGEQA